MTDPTPAAPAPRPMPTAALVVAAGVGAFALTFCGALLLGRGFVGASLSALLVPIAASGAVAVALVAAFGVATTVEQAGGRVRVGRAVSVLVPVAAAVAVFAYAADPTTGAGRALGRPGADSPATLVPRPQRTIGVAPPAVVAVAPRPAGTAPGERGDAGPPAVVVGAPQDGPGDDAPAAGTPVAPAAPVVDGAQPPVAGPVVPPRDKGRPSAAPRPERPRQLPDDPDLDADPRTPDPNQPRFGPTAPRPTTAPEAVVSPADPVATPKAVESPEPVDSTPRAAKAPRAVKKAAAPKPLPPACHRAKAPKRPAVCRKR